MIDRFVELIINMPLIHEYGDPLPVNTDMLARDMDKGRDLARTLGDNTCLLMRGHGAVVTSTEVRKFDSRPPGS